MNGFKWILHFLRLTNDVIFFTPGAIFLKLLSRGQHFLLPHIHENLALTLFLIKYLLNSVRVLPSIVFLDLPSAFAILLSSYDNGSYKDNLLKLHKYLLEVNVLQLCHGHHIVLTQSRVSTSSG
jgi:hypothetical protein